MSAEHPIDPAELGLDQSGTAKPLDRPAKTTRRISPWSVIGASLAVDLLLIAGAFAYADRHGTNPPERPVPRPGPAGRNPHEGNHVLDDDMFLPVELINHPEAEQKSFRGDRPQALDSSENLELSRQLRERITILRGDAMANDARLLQGQSEQHHLPEAVIGQDPGIYAIPTEVRGPVKRLEDIEFKEDVFFRTRYPKLEKHTISHVGADGVTVVGPPRTRWYRRQAFGAKAAYDDWYNGKPRPFPKELQSLSTGDLEYLARLQEDRVRLTEQAQEAAAEINGPAHLDKWKDPTPTLRARTFNYQLEQAVTVAINDWERLGSHTPCEGKIRLWVVNRFPDDKHAGATASGCDISFLPEYVQTPILQMTAHEVGHTIGYCHSNKPRGGNPSRQSVMYSAEANKHSKIFRPDQIGHSDCQAPARATESKFIEPADSISTQEMTVRSSDYDKDDSAADTR